MRLRPEVMRRPLGFGRERIQVPHGDAVAAHALARAGAGRRRADVEADIARRREIESGQRKPAAGESIG